MGLYTYTTWLLVTVFGTLAASLFPIFIKNKTGVLLSQFFQHRQRHVVDHVGMLLDKDLPLFRTDMAIPSQVRFLECLHAQSKRAPELTMEVGHDPATTIQTHQANKSLHSELHQYIARWLFSLKSVQLDVYTQYR